MRDAMLRTNVAGFYGLDFGSNAQQRIAEPVELLLGFAFGGLVQRLSCA